MKQNSCIFVIQGKITAQGRLLLQDSLLVAEIGSRSKADKLQFCDRRVFLFEQIIVFSEEFVDKRRSSLTSPSYIFKHSIKVAYKFKIA